MTDDPSLLRVSRALQAGRSEDALDQMLLRLFEQLMAALRSQGVTFAPEDEERIGHAVDEAERCHHAAMAAHRQTDVVTGRVAIIGAALGQLSVFHTELAIARLTSEPTEDRRWSLIAFGALMLGISSGLPSEGLQFLQAAAAHDRVRRGSPAGNRKSQETRGAWRQKALAHCQSLDANGRKLTNEQLADSIFAAGIGCKSHPQALRAVGEWRRGGALLRRVPRSVV
jgi:hypothetical protein